jgi:hypothetical protein
MKRLLSVALLGAACAACFAAGRYSSPPQLTVVENAGNKTIELWSQNSGTLVAEYQKEDGELYTELRLLLHEDRSEPVGQAMQVASAGALGSKCD